MVGGQQVARSIKLRNGVTFHDGEKMDAAAVKYNLERHKNMQGSNRRGELAVVSSVDAVDRARPCASTSRRRSRRCSRCSPTAPA